MRVRHCGRGWPDERVHANQPKKGRSVSLLLILLIVVVVLLLFGGVGYGRRGRV